MTMKRIAFVTLFLGLAGFVAAQNLYLNGSFETAGPAYWQYDYLHSTGTPQYISGAVDAGHGSAYVRINAPATSSYNLFKGWTPSSSNYRLLPNCRYRLTYMWRTSHTALTRNIAYVEAGSIVSGNSALEYFLADDGFISLSEETSGVWVTSSFELSTPPNEAWNKSFGYVFSAGTFAFLTSIPASTFDYDNMQLELLQQYTTATCHIAASSVSTYDYSNTDCKIRFLTNDQTADHQVEKKSGLPPSIGSTPALSKYWIIDSFPGTFTATVIFSYSDMELTAAGLSESSLRLLRKEGAGLWTEVSSTVNASENTIQTASPVSSFSSWAIAGPAVSSVDDWLLYDSSKR